MSATIDLHAAMRAALPVIRESLPEGVLLACEPALVEAHVAVPIDALHDALLALVQNAVTAMPSGGLLTIRTEHVEAMGAELGPIPPLAPGRYMRITVQDTGLGMDELARVRAIDVRDDESRGLARVLAVAQRVRGALWLDSATSLGTRAFLYLPQQVARDAPPSPTVLLVEDEGAVRSVVRRMLLGQGFLVRETRDGESALRVWLAERERIVAVVTDVVMPVMGGRDLARALRAEDPSVPLLFISAYAGDDADLLEGVEAPRYLLGKPFSNEALLAALRALLPAAAA